MYTTASLLLAGLALVALPGYAQPAPQGQRPGQGQSGQPQGTGQGQGERRGPPPEALAACKALAAGAACQFTSPRGAESGSCFAPEGKPLACRPQHHGGGGVTGAGGGSGDSRPPPKQK